MKQKQKILVISPGHIPTVEIITRSLNYLSPYFEIKVVSEHNIPFKAFFSGQYKVLFIRQCNPSLKPFLDLLKAFNFSYLYYLDDNFWEMKEVGALSELYQAPEVKDTLTQFVQNAEYVITGSEYLNDYVKQHFNPHAICIKPAFGFDLIENVQQDVKSESLQILYSGSLYRDAEFKCVIPALKKILIEYQGKINLCFHGYVPEQLKNLPGVIFDENFYPYNEYIKKKYQTNYSIGLAPLTPTVANYSKTNLKYREYGACKIVGVYSAQPPYSDCVQNNETGLLVENSIDAWYNAIKSLIDNAEWRNQIAEAAYIYIKNQHRDEVISAHWKEIFDKQSPNKAQNLYAKFCIVKINAYLLLIHYKIKRVIPYYRSHGWIHTFKKIIEHLGLAYKKN